MPNIVISRKRLWITLAVLVSVLLPAIGAFWLVLPDDDDGVDGAMREIGFYPITPPSALTSVGAVYHVTDFGSQYNTVCGVTPELLGDRLRYAPTEKIIENKLVRASSNLATAWMKKFNRTIKADAVKAVKFRLTDVEVGEIPLSELMKIFIELQKDEACERQIDALLQAGEFVCQGHSILRATAVYDVNVEGGVEDTTKISKNLLQDIKANIDTSARIVDNEIRSGEQLHYGIRVSPLCMTLPDATRPARLPETRFGWYWQAVRKRLPW